MALEQTLVPHGALHEPLDLGFVGLGWIGRSRLRAAVEAGVARPAAVLEPSNDALTEAGELVTDAERVQDLAALLDHDLDGIVVATPNHLHRDQVRSALAADLPVFCQKPLAPTSQGVRDLVELARDRDLALGIDLSYRWTQAVTAVADQVRAGELGQVYALEATFHNAYGPDKAWCHDVELAGGGCLLDLGVHLVDLVLWLTGAPAVESVDARLWRQGQRLGPDPSVVEDHARVHLDLEGGVSADVATSWNLHAGTDCIIELRVHGTDAGAVARNVDGSFYALEALRFDGRERVRLVAPPDDWPGRALVAWAHRVARGEGFDEALGQATERTHAVLDEVYGR